MQVNWLPMALCTSMAATDESTPPERPQMTWPLPTFSRIEATVVSMKCAGVQSPRAPQMSRKFPMSCGPSGVWCTSGWNCTAQMRSSRVFDGRQRVVSDGNAAKACGQLQRLVAVAHPDLDGRRQPGEERRRCVFDGDFGVAVLAFGRRAHFAAEVVDDEMEPIADAEDRDAQRQHARIGLGRVGIVNRRRTAGKNHADGVVGLNIGQRRRAGHHHGEDILFADAPRDELRILRPEIEDDDCLGVHAPSVAGGGEGCKERKTRPNPLAIRSGTAPERTQFGPRKLYTRCGALA